jgi:16S rRNA processing protein RimM
MTDYPERYQGLRRAFVGGTEYAVERVWYHKERPIFKFQGVDSISAAEALAGKDVCVPAEDRLKLPEGEYFFSDLVGCRVVDAASGAQVGTVSGWQEIGPGSPVLLEVDAGGRDPVLVPFASKLLKKIDVKGREIRVELPEGLAELNR